MSDKTPSSTVRWGLGLRASLAHGRAKIEREEKAFAHSPPTGGPRSCSIKPKRRLPSHLPERWIFLATLAVLIASGCAQLPAVPAPPPNAHLSVINLTDYEWGLIIAAPGQPPVFDAHVQPRTTVTLELKSGDYVIEQTMVSLDARPGQDRQIPTRFEPGQSYRWRLATLLSAGSEDANGSAR